MTRLTRGLAGRFLSWRPLLRLAARDALRARGRSVLVLVMIALPVLAVTAADVVIRTSDVSSTEAVSRRIGGADAMVRFLSSGQVWQQADPDRVVATDGKPLPADLDAPAAIRKALGPGVRVLERREGSVRIRTPKGIAEVQAAKTDLTDPLTTGLFRREAGRLPTRADEIAVNAALLGRLGVEPGGTIELEDGTTLTVTGVLRDAWSKNDRVWVPPSGVDVAAVADEAEGSQWLVDAGRPVTWTDVRVLNHLGASVVSPEVLAHPPARSEIPPEVSYSESSSITQSSGAVIALVVVMALLEVVLLAGPAFAVGARRQSRTLALLASTGATPRQLRRVVLGGALVLGTAAAAVGVLLGVGVARLVLPVAQQHDVSYFGPFDVRPLELLGVAAFGLASAVLAAVVPARIAARQDVVAVLGGRRGDRRPRVWSPLAGLVLVGVGVALSIGAATRGSGTEVPIAGSAVIVVLGTILLIPVFLVVAGQLSRGLPLPMRYAVRDAARHRTRTVPAVAAVAATVAGVVALGIGASSDELQSRHLYTPRLPLGMASLTNPDRDPMTSEPKHRWPLMVAAVRAGLPGHTVREVDGLPNEAEIMFAADGRTDLLDSYGASYGASVLVGDGRLPDADLGVSIADRSRADAVLARGGAVVFTSSPVEGDQVQVRMRLDDPKKGRIVRRARATVPALFVTVTGTTASAEGVVSPDVARRLGVKPAPVGLAVSAPVTRSQERGVDEALSAVTVGGPNYFYVERGYQQPGDTVVLLLVLGVLGGVLMLGGTLTATFLALSDARSDLATLAAVGASGRSRRLIAAAYAATVGLIGAALGAAVGFVPGIAVTYPLTGPDGGFRVDAQGHPLPSHFVDVPWLLVGAVVLLLPLLTALVVGLSARSRLPMVARLN